MWNACGLEPIRQQLLACQSPMELLEAVFKLPEDRKLSSICLLWCWWTERNKANHKQSRMMPNEFQYIVRRSVEEWKEFFAKKPSGMQRPVQKWLKPGPDLVKINIDAAFNRETGAGGWGLIARDVDGEVVFAASGSLSHQTEALHAETSALLLAIQLAESQGWGGCFL